MRKCPYCKLAYDIPHSSFLDHMIRCGNPGLLPDRRIELSQELRDVDRQILALTERKKQIQIQIDDINYTLPGQIKMRI